MGVLVGLFALAAGAFLLYRHSQAQHVGKLAGWGAQGGGVVVVVSNNPMAGALGAAAQARPPPGPRPRGEGEPLQLAWAPRPPPGPPPRRVGTEV